MKKKSVAVLGAGNMGTALAKVIAENGYHVKVWNYSGDIDPLKEIQKFQENKKYLPGIRLPKLLEAVFDMNHALENVQVIFLVVSSGAIESVMKEALPFLKPGMILVDVSKGMHPKTHEIIPKFIQKMLGRKKLPLVGLTGPAVAKQFAEGQPAVMVAASSSLPAAKAVQKVLHNSYLKILTGTDIVGGEVVQSFKNVYAIGLGMAQGLGLGFNTQAILFTRALQEMALLNKSLGGKMDTVYGFAGLGDFLTTALSSEGRNRRFGECLGQGLCSTDATVQVKQTVEGIAATIALKTLAKKHKLKLDFAFAIDSVIEGKKTSGEAIDGLLKKM